MPGWQFRHAKAHNQTATSIVRITRTAGLKKNTTRMMMSGKPFKAALYPQHPKPKEIGV